ncbi:hypothetical protein PtB15_4B718 [Puccinia triticina]|nr:hypothetical protein PtB15_4B718 [Puccinia triticina]
MQVNNDLNHQLIRAVLNTQPSLAIYPSRAPRPDQAIHSAQDACPEEQTLSAGHCQHQLIRAVLDTQPSLANAILALVPILSSSPRPSHQHQRPSCSSSSLSAPARSGCWPSPSTVKLFPSNLQLIANHYHPSRPPPPRIADTVQKKM